MSQRQKYLLLIIFIILSGIVGIILSMFFLEKIPVSLQKILSPSLQKILPLLSSESNSGTTSDTLGGWENFLKKTSITNIVSHIGIGEEDKNTVKHFLENAEADCLGKNFLEYRACFINQIQKREALTGLSNTIRSQIEQFKQSLEKEIENIKHYEAVDAMPRKTETDAIGTGSICRTIGIKAPYSGISISYLENKIPKLSELFQLEKKKNFYDFIGDAPYYARIPCKSYTWGPDVRNIFAFHETREFYYLFIKTQDGAGSGEFQYAIIAVDKNSSRIESIGSFWTFVWAPILTTMEIDPNNPDVILTKTESIFSLFKNTPFLYQEIFHEEYTKDIILSLEDQIR